MCVCVCVPSCSQTSLHLQLMLNKHNASEQQQHHNGAWKLPFCGRIPAQRGKQKQQEAQQRTERNKTTRVRRTESFSLSLSLSLHRTLKANGGEDANEPWLWFVHSLHANTLQPVNRKLLSCFWLWTPAGYRFQVKYMMRRFEALMTFKNEDWVAADAG